VNAARTGAPEPGILRKEHAVARLNISLPDDLKHRFFATFPNENKSALIARLIDEAIRRTERERAGRQAAGRILARRAAAPPLSEAAFRKLREQGRR
jgi:hypothetical protein